MLGKEPFRIVFGAGVVRFDAHGHLFVNLPHSDDHPQKVWIGGPDGDAVPAPERRARVHGTQDGGATEGAFPASAELPRGLTVEVKGYERARLEDGQLVVHMPAESTIPNWWESARDHHFKGDGPVRLWAKSSIPEGVSIEGDVPRGGPPTQPKPAARAQFQPKTEKAETPAPSAEAGPAPAGPTPSPEGEAQGQPYRPGRLPAGHHKPAGAKTSGLGCSTLVALVALAVGTLMLVS